MQTHVPPKGEKPSSRIPTLDGLRAISILFVLVGHMAGNRYVPHVFKGLLDYAAFGVRIFFIISGFLITGLLLREQSKNGRISLKNFYIRRVLRIFPASYTYFIAVVVASIAGYIALNRHDISAAIFYWMNFHYNRSWWVGHIWSLSVEEQFYLLWPAVLAFGGWKLGRKVAVGVLCFSPIFRIVMSYLAPQLDWGLTQFFPAVADTMAVGCLLAGFRERLWENALYRRVLESRFFFVIPLLAVGGVQLGNFARVYLLFTNTAINVCIAMTIDWCIRNHRSTVGRVLEWRPIAFLGVLSYSLYLWQQPWLNYKQDAIIANPLVGVSLALGCALLSYFLVERPFLSLKDRLFSTHGDTHARTRAASASVALSESAD